MPVYCSVPECTTKGTSGMHRYPADPQLKQKWLDATKTHHLKDSKNFRICRKHFMDCDLLLNTDGKKTLASNAVPRLLLPLSLNWDHGYHLIGPPKKRSFKRLKKVHCADISDNNVGDEIEINAAKTDEAVNVGSYINMEYVRSLEEKIFQQRKENLKISRKLKNVTTQVKRLQRKTKTRKLDDEQVLEYLRNVKKYSSAQIEFTKMQLRNSKRKPHGRRYNANEKSMCLAMYKSGPRSYRFKESNKIMVLPTLSTLTRHSAKMIFRTGIVPQLFSFIKEKVKDWPAKDLLCSFGFDETALKSVLEYSSTDDEIIGFVELGTLRRPIFASHALTFMVRGIHRPFKQPVAHFYTHGLKSNELADLILLVLEAVISSGLNVIHSVSDQVKTNESAIHRLMDRHFARTTGCLLKYKVGDKTIIHGYDAPHWLKVIRNNLEVKNFRHYINQRWTVATPKMYGKVQIASWDDVKRVYDLDRTGCPRLLHKITDEHIRPQKLKMKVCVATQVFSETYSTVMKKFVERKLIPESSCATAQLLLFFNDLFDSANGFGPSQNETLKGSINKDSFHFAFWEWALFMLSKMDFIDKVTGEVNSYSTVINKVQSTIRGYQEVTRICLNNDIEEVSLRNTDSDGLENFFGCVKSCCQIACSVTPRQFRSGYTTMILNNLMNAKSMSTNCEPDHSVALLNDVHDLIENHISIVNEERSEHCSAINDFSCDVLFDPQFTENELNFYETESTEQIAGMTCSKILERIHCVNCERYLLAESEHAESVSVPKFPSINFIEIFKKIFEFSLQSISFVASEKSLKKFLIEGFKKANPISQLTIIGCVDHNEEMINMLIELGVVYTIKIFCKNINDILRGKIKDLPPDPNPLQQLASTFHTKKIRKHSDIFQI